MRRDGWTRRVAPVLAACGLAVAMALPALGAPAPAGFTAFLRQFEPLAIKAGVSKAVYEKAVAGLSPDPRIHALVATQPEFSTPIWDYLDARVTDKRVAQGRAAMAANAALFARIGRAYGVDPAILGAIWGIETNYGSVLSSHVLIRPVVRSLATLCYLQRGRLALDEAELIAALKLVQQGPLDAQTLVGSWAGAIGHLQVNPTTVLEYGTDGDGDGKIDLQHSLADALATSAKFLLALGYSPGLDWGYEVRLPADFDYLLADRNNPHPASFFAARGVKRINGAAFPDPAASVFLYVPAGKDGPKFLMTRNYLVLKGYNFSDSYALAVAHLADRLKGAGDFAAPWPRDTRFPDLQQRQAIQAALVRLGLLKGATNGGLNDGRLGPASQRAYAQFQARHGQIADGFITLAAYQQLTTAVN